MATIEKPTNAAPEKDLQSLINITTVVYALQAVSFLLGITWIVAVIVNYVKLEDVAGTWLASHFRWQIRTFWFGLLWGVIGAIMLLIMVGFFVLVADAIWIIYRIVKGWLRLNDRKEMCVGKGGSMNGILTSAIVILVVSATATIWGFWYRQNHVMEGVMGKLFGGSNADTYSMAGWALGIGILAFLIGIGLLIAGLVRSGGNKPIDRPPT